MPANLIRQAAVAALLAVLPAMAAAATSDVIDETAPAPKSGVNRVETVRVVYNWVLCVDQPSAEKMARAQEAGADAAQKAYDGLAQAKTCGRFKKFGVLLHKQLKPAFGIDQATRVFAASVNIGVGWMDAFVVTGEEGEVE
jgi:hypothetical protein